MEYERDACPHSVLIVEDDSSIRDLLNQALMIEGYEVNPVKHGKEALDFLANNKQPCVILLDLMMPVMDGFEFLRRIKSDLSKQTAHIPIVIASASGSAGEEAHRYNLPIIRKPLDLSRVLEIVEKYCTPRAS